MEFLPVIINGKQVYAGFWVRLAAGLVDAFIIIPLAFGIYYFQHLNIAFAIILAALSTALFGMYNVYFNAVFGGTPGKLVAGIRVTKPNGEKIGWCEAWYRSSVDLVFAALFFILELTALFKIDWGTFQSTAFFDRLGMIYAHYPVWVNAVDIGNNIWVWGELIVLLLNERKRAIHDYIADTVVLHKEFTDQEAPVDVTAAVQPSHN